MSERSVSPEVTSYIHNFRDDIQQCWDLDTAYHKDRAAAGPGKSRGQCVVTSLLLQECLLDSHNVESKILLGQVQNTDGSILIPGHGWLRLNNTFVDLTVDQADSVEIRVLIAQPNETAINGLVYLHGMPDSRDAILKHSETRLRYELLKNRYNHRFASVNK